jgi:hypothetical protein
LTKASAMHSLLSEGFVSEKHLIEAIASRYKEMKPEDRVAEIRELTSRSAEDAEFIRQKFPELFAEAFPTQQEKAQPQRRVAGGCSGSDWQTSLAAKPQ